MTFREDGVYSAICPGDCQAMYWGTDDDSDDKTYQIDDVNADGVGFGHIVLYFAGGNTLIVDFREVVLSEDAKELSFEVWRPDTAGPVQYALTRP